MFFMKSHDVTDVKNVCFFFFFKSTCFYEVSGCNSYPLVIHVYDFHLLDPICFYEELVM